MSLKNKIAIFTDKTFMKFVMVGIVNTIVGTTIMFVFYNVFHLNYWISSASNYFFGSLISFILNKHFTFNYHKNNSFAFLKFSINIVICYLLAYGIAKPFIRYILFNYDKTIQENIALFVGMCLFVISNYLGQRFFAFKQWIQQN